MEQPQQLELIPRASGELTPFNARDALGTAIVYYGLPLPRSFKARLGKGAKELLEDGFPPNTVIAALVLCCEAGRPHLASSFAVDLTNAQAGQLWDWQKYRARLAELNHQAKLANDPEAARLYDTLKGAFK